MDWFLYENGIRHERVKRQPIKWLKTLKQFVCKGRQIV